MAALSALIVLRSKKDMQLSLMELEVFYRVVLFVIPGVEINSLTV
jgi:hypothetical protein